MDINIEELIKKRAYEIYVRRTQDPIWKYGKWGTKEGDWKQAERELLKEVQDGKK
jgi:hypothetical protein